MTKEAFTQHVWAYVKDNWFKIALLVLLVFVFFKKDLSFRINLNSPDPTEQNMLPQQPTQTSRPKKRELMTEDRSLAGVENLETNRFDLYGIGSNLSLGQSSELAKIDEAKIGEFLNRFSQVAVDERKKFGIPSSIILASGLLQSLAGQRDMSLKGNNFFAVPCTPDWQGEKGTYQGNCYRHYTNAWTSFRDYSYFLTTGRNAKLKDLGPKNYKAWAKAMEAAQVSEQEDLAEQLIRAIEYYQLAKWDVVD